ncbi:Formin, FH2 domain, partial [Dillenia turbinata]
VLAEKLPELLDFSKDLTSLEAATKIQLKYLAEEMQAISKGLEKVVQELTASENDGPVSEDFSKTLKEFLGFAEAEVRSLASLYSAVGRNADALALYFGEDPARVPFEQVVSTLLNFVRMLTRAHEENCKQIEFEKKKVEKEAENEKKDFAVSLSSEKLCGALLMSSLELERVKSRVIEGLKGSDVIVEGASSIELDLNDLTGEEDELLCEPGVPWLCSPSYVATTKDLSSTHLCTCNM